MRSLPNVIITGTPGVGKSQHALLLSKQSGLHHLAINDLVKEKQCHEGWDKEYESYIVDETKVLKETAALLEQGGLIIDWHICDIFPLDLIDLVVVLRADHTVLYNRLEKRKYKSSKIEENIDAEIMQVILDEARDAYDEHTVVELVSEDESDLDANLERMQSWIRQWKEENANKSDGANK